jgi:hypothetical protein
MRTHRVTTLELDRARLQPEIERAWDFRYSEAYSDYLCGGPWKSCMLWTAGGEAGDGFITNYDAALSGAKTPSAQQMSYLWSEVERHFDLRYLRFARLALISNSVIIPHKDLLEYGKLLHRVHLPLVTNDRCFFSEANVVYRMRFGEVWFFDAATMHSAASFSDERRLHLILDFADVPQTDKFVRHPGPAVQEIAADSIKQRPPLTAEERKDLMALARLVDAGNFRDVFSIVIRKHYERDGGDNFVWNTMMKIADANQDPEVERRVREMYQYFMVERA